MLGHYWSGFWNENKINPLSSINWRASLLPAAAVIPAPIAYIKVVAVKKLVVEFLVGRVLASVDIILNHPYEKLARTLPYG